MCLSSVTDMGIKRHATQRPAMKHVRLELTAGGRESEIHPMYDLLANAAFVDRVKTTHWNVSGDELGIMHFVYGEMAPFETALQDIDSVLEYELTQVDEDSFYAYLRSELTAPAGELFGTLTRGRLVVVHPVEWHPDGTQSIAVMGSTDEIQAVVDGLPDPVECTVREIGGLEQAAEAAKAQLSDRQQEALEQALELGYYDIPREASVEDVAEAIGCARSTAAEHLRKTESKLLHSVFRS